MNFSHGFVVRNDASGFHVANTAPDALDNLELALDVSRDRLGGEKGFAAPRVLGQSSELVL